ncbi:MAG TPA: PEP-CTERM sorting domain-containing protein [Verrucomicrobiae bacterium]|nr:PEP-CTERM sorting domain-containing protein [Verrucomicrobiae bacterium]
MRKIATALGLFGLVISANAQGTFYVDSSPNAGNGSGPIAASGGLVWLDSDGILADATLDTTVDINLSIMWGTSANNVNNAVNLDPLQLNNPANRSWLASQPTGVGDITTYANGAILDPNGNTYFLPGEAAGTTIFLQLYAWTGNSPTFDNGGLKGVTAPFPITLVSSGSVGYVDVSGMSALVLSVPEPSLLALFAFSAFSFTLFRRKAPSI